MTIKTFGGFEISELKKVKFTPKEIEIITYLTLNNSTGTLINNLLDEIWYYNDEKNPKKELSVYIAKINKKINKIGKISSKNSKLKIYTDNLTCDAKQFEKFSNEFLHNQKIETGVKALELYSGRFLPNINNNWVENYRFMYENLLLNVVKFLLTNETDLVKKTFYLEKLIHVGIYEKINEDFGELLFNKRQLNDYIPNDLFNFLFEKDKLLRNPRYICISLTLRKEINIFKYLRKGDFATKKNKYTINILLEKNPKINSQKVVESFIKRLTKDGIKLKHLKILK
ncbi:MAG: hypothetical protein H0Z24_02330 [Thermosipho sp. (in: Bacteria)]|nr:hypothetical protein [Thermosipho sp. (in: thermotogales)]